ncbi:MAG TPA: SMI1/KNR4 family protein [Ktedonobacterales bacterium]
MYLDAVRARLAALGFVSPAEMLPCSEREVEILERHLGVTLPQAYKEYLLWIGHGAGRFERGTDCFYADVFDNRDGAEQLLSEDNFPQKLPEDAVVFSMHQGYQFSFFRTSEGDDPPVYYYLEDSGQTGFRKTFPSFSNLLMTIVNSQHEFLVQQHMIQPSDSE